MISLILLSILRDLYDSYIVTEKIRTESHILQLTKANFVYFFHSDIFPLGNREVGLCSHLGVPMTLT